MATSPVVMATGSSQALVRRSADSELMPPPPKRIKRPQKVLDEDTYVSGISEIIARDFFPGLLETETQQEYLDALESKDRSWISSASQRLSKIMTPGRKRGRRGTSIQNTAVGSETPRGYGGDTPMSVVSDISATSTRTMTPKVVDTNMSLDAFQAKYTSEDNESFYKLLDKQNQKRAEKHAWMWNGNKMPSNRLLKQKEVEVKLLEARGSLHDDGGKKDWLAIRDVTDKPAMPDTWKAKPNNSLMFSPDGVEDSAETVAQKAQVESRAAPKSVVYDNTRIPPMIVNDPQIPPSPSLSAIRDAIAGRPRRTDSESGFDGNETPRVNGYAFVDDEPESEERGNPEPSIMLGKGDATPNPFKIMEQSKREDLHHRMVDRVAKTKRALSKIGMMSKVGQTPVPKFPNSPRVGAGGLTPAGHRLWSKVGAPSKTRSPLAFDTPKTPSALKPKESKLRVGWKPR
jgi:protein DGCR14